jgi:hypothetical protein
MIAKVGELLVGQYAGLELLSSVISLRFNGALQLLCASFDMYHMLLVNVQCLSSYMVQRIGWSQGTKYFGAYTSSSTCYIKL